MKISNLELVGLQSVTDEEIIIGFRDTSTKTFVADDGTFFGEKSGRKLEDYEVIFCINSTDIAIFITPNIRAELSGL